MRQHIRMGSWIKLKGLLLDGGRALFDNVDAVGFAYAFIICENTVDVVPFVADESSFHYLILPRLRLALFAIDEPSTRADDPKVVDKRFAQIRCLVRRHLQSCVRPSHVQIDCGME